MPQSLTIIPWNKCSKPLCHRYSILHCVHTCKQSVALNAAHSNSPGRETGIPQGYIPRLVLIFVSINDLFSQQKNQTCRFADDDSVQDSFSFLHETGYSSIHLFQSWDNKLVIWKMSVNTWKTHILTQSLHKHWLVNTPNILYFCGHPLSLELLGLTNTNNSSLAKKYLIVGLQSRSLLKNSPQGRAFLSCSHDSCAPLSQWCDIQNQNKESKKE